jgi:hypothetical protein
MQLKEKESEGMDWIHRVRGRILWWTLVNTMVSLWFPINGGKFVDQLDSHQFLKKNTVASH